MASFANHNFDSEDEDDDFNPAPADVSDDEAAGDGEARDGNAVANRRESLATEAEPPARSPSPGQQVRRSSVEDEAADSDGLEDRVNGATKASEAHQDGGGKADVEIEVEGYEEGDARGDEEDEDEDEEDEEDEDEEDGEVQGRPHKRRKRDRRNQFIDVEAEVDEDEEDENEDDEDMPGDQFIAETHPDDLAELPPGGERDDRRHRELDRRRELAENMDAEKQAAALKERYGRSRAAPVDSVVVPQRLLLPSVEDPTIWGVGCKIGKEKEVIFSIMKRFEERMSTRAPLAIMSAFERGGGPMAGYIYVEARRQADVLTAVEGISNCYPRSKMTLVPINEMPDLLRTTKSKSLEPGMYVRMLRGKYKGDLAQIDEVESNDLDVTVRVVPRLDYGLNDDANAPQLDAKRKRPPGFGANSATARPPQRLFSETEAKKRHSKFLTQTSTLDRSSWTYLGDTYVNGFLIKDVKIQHLQIENVNPTLDEVTKFAAGASDGSENLDLAALAATLKTGKAGADYLPGDMVEIYDGEQQGVCGRATAVHGDIVTMQVTEGQLRGQTIEAPIKSLRKRFKEGDHVKVVGASKYHDEVGMVVKIKDDKVTILSDSNNEEITVFSKDLREASDSGGALASSKYDLYDLVQLDPASVACVIKVDRESLKVIDQNGSVLSLLPSNISNKLERRRNAVATDRDGSEIRPDDTVKETGGESRSGKVLHIHRGYLFLQSRQQSENGGIFVVRHSNVTTVAAKGGRVTNTGPDLTKMNPAVIRSATGSNGPMPPPPQRFGRDRIIGKTVACTKGPLKGYKGIVKDTTDVDARVEFHAKNKIVTIPKAYLVVKDPITGETIHDKGSAARSRMPPSGYGGATPRVPDWQGGSRTPIAANGGRTPAWGMAGAAAGARTPAWQSTVANSGRTPAWTQQNQGGRTPAWSGGDGSRTVNPYADGSRTAYGGVTTSSWNPNSRTPFHPSGFDPGSKTPGHNILESSTTPAYSGGTAYEQSHVSYDAPTPGFSSAPTPGAADHATPGASRGGHDRHYGGRHYGGTYGTPAAAPTPGAFPETPGAWGAETAAVNAAEDDPRYE